MSSRLGRFLPRTHAYARACATTLVLTTLTTLTMGFLPACSKADAQDARATKEPEGSDKAAIVVTDDTKGLLFTWIDEKGEFHVEESQGAVPPTQREHVRVIDPAKQEPAGQIHLVDLRTKGADGTYPVRLAQRTAFDAVASSRRAPVKGTRQGSGKGTANGEGLGEADAQKAVVVYGASWCGACQKTRAYLKSKHIPFADKDIDNDSSAAREMRAKLAKAGIQSQGIPVIDVGGELMVGFDPGAIDRALNKGS